MLKEGQKQKKVLYDTVFSERRDGRLTSTLNKINVQFANEVNEVKFSGFQDEL